MLHDKEINKVFIKTKLGEKGFGFRTQCDVQDFYKIFEECLINGEYDKLLYYSKHPDRHFEWKTPMEIVEDPKLFLKGFSRFNVQQRELDDCWLLAAVANLTLYRKLHGSYEALKGGSTCEAIENFTGSVTKMNEFEAYPPDLFKILLKVYERSSLMGCSLESDPNVLETETKKGLIRGYVHSITFVKYVEIQSPNTGGRIPLIPLKNPWDNKTEWNGPWNDQSPKWRFIPEHEKHEMGLTFDTDGEFWMVYTNFTTYFLSLEILSDEKLLEAQKKKWVISVFEGDWARGVTVGGYRNFLDTFWHNSQYSIPLTDVDERDNEEKCTLIEMSCRFKLSPGTNCIVPSTFDPKEEGEFLLRVFSENQNHVKANHETDYVSEHLPAPEYELDNDLDDNPYNCNPGYNPGYPSQPTLSPYYPPYITIAPNYPPYPSSVPGYPPPYRGHQQSGYQHYPPNPGYSQNSGYPNYPGPGQNLVQNCREDGNRGGGCHVS